MSNIIPITESGFNKTVESVPVSVRDTPLEVVETSPLKNGHFSSLKGEEGRTQSTITKRSMKEENSSNETKDAKNTVIGTANPSRTSSTPTDISSEGSQHLTQPETVSSEDKYYHHPVSSKSTTFVSQDEHDTAVKQMEANNEKLYKEKEMEKKEKASLKKECKELHDQRRSLQTNRTETYNKLSELSEENKNTHDKMQEMKSVNRDYERRNSQLEIDLEIANKKIEQLEKEREEDKKIIKQLQEKIEHFERSSSKTQ